MDQDGPYRSPRQYLRREDLPFDDGGERVYRGEDYVPPPENRVTVGKTAAMRDDWYDSVRMHVARETTGHDEGIKLLQGLRAEQAKAAPDDRVRAKPVLGDGNLEQIFPKELPRQLVARAAVALGRPLDETATDVRDGYIRHVNAKPWNPIQRDIHEQGEGGGGVRSRIEPVNETFHENYRKYRRTGLGSMSGRLTPDGRSDDEKTRPVNLWKTSLARDDGTTLFEGMRSGAFVDSATDPTERKQNAQAKGKGVLEAALIDKLRAMSPKDREPYLRGDLPYDGTMVSIDLLSGAGADKSLSNEHHDTLKGLSGQLHGYDIDWEGQKRTVGAKFNILDFATGVNGMNTQTGMLPHFGLDSQSKSQADANAASMAALRQHVRVFEATREKMTDPATDAKREKIRALDAGIDEVGLGKSGSYQLPAMLANLAYQLDASVHFNCKSGKDRTGIMDSETKFMARQLDKQRGKGPMRVPDVSNRDRRDPLQNYEHDQMLWESGSLDVLAQNVGGQCLKTADLATAPFFKALPTSDKVLSDNLGGKEMLTELAGLKRYADIDTIASFEEKGITGKLNKMSKREKKSYRKDAIAYMGALPEPAAPPLPPRAGAPRRDRKPLPARPTKVVDVSSEEEPETDPSPRPKGVPKGAFKLV